jgi:insecticidal toxin complex protein TccC
LVQVGETERFQYDPNGNLLAIPNLFSITWNELGQMTSAVLVTRADGENDVEYYHYDNSGQRVRKVPGG